jgi:hypothetical protein
LTDFQIKAYIRLTVAISVCVAELDHQTSRQRVFRKFWQIGPQNFLVYVVKVIQNQTVALFSFSSSRTEFETGKRRFLFFFLKPY